jgi:predicted PurR-regulated permease PerM
MTPKQENLASKFRWWLIGATLILFIYLLSPILAPFIAAAIIAYICNPLVNRICTISMGKLTPNRTAATLSVMLILLAAILLLLLIVIPLLQKELLLVIERLPQYGANLRKNFEPWLMHNLGLTFDFDIPKLQKILTENWKTAGGFVGTLMLTVSKHGAAILSWFVNLLLVPLVLFYMLRDWHEMLESISALIPRRMLSKTKQIASEVDEVLAQFLRGQLTVMLIMSIFYAVGLSLAGLDLAMPIGILSGLLGFVPYLGITTGVILATLSGLLEFNSINQLIPIFIVFTIGQLLENMWLTPTLVGDRIGLHPAVVIFALLAGGQLFGFTGVLLALPASGALAVALRHVRRSYMNSDFYQ